MHNITPLYVLLDILCGHDRVSEEGFPGEIIDFHAVDCFVPQIFIAYIAGQDADLVTAFQKALYHIIKDSFPAAYVRVEVGKDKTNFHRVSPPLN